MGLDEQGRFVQQSGFVLLHPEETVFSEMLQGFRRQQLTRNLAFSTVENREGLIRRFATEMNEYPWAWSVDMVDEFFADRRAVHGNQRSTIRSYQNALSGFTDYICSESYGWIDRCMELFDTHPAPVFHYWNTARHIQEAEHGGRRRPFRHTELQAFFDRADDEVERIARTDRKGWAAAFRDATLFKIAYCFGLRRNEVRHLETFDFSRNRKAPEFGKYGHLNVRYGKAMRGSDYKQRNVLALFPWGSEILEEWLERGHPHLATEGGTELFTTERGTFVSETALGARFRQYRDDIGLGREVVMHSLRHSYITHLIEAGAPAYFVQRQVGHEYASTTALYTGVSDEYLTSTVRDMLGGTIGDALRNGSKE